MPVGFPFGVCFLMLGDCTEGREISGDRVIRVLGFGDWEIGEWETRDNFSYFPNIQIPISGYPNIHN
jgi:hypothetical protein